MDDVSVLAESQTQESSVTRVFVSGLPPSMTKEHLRSHFASKFTVNDAHVVSDRRIGFVGFSNHTTAKLAAKYFNRSFINLSKISVTLAKPVEVRRTASGQATPVSLHRASKNRDAIVDQSRKRKREDTEDDEKARGPPPALNGALSSQRSAPQEHATPGMPPIHDDPAHVDDSINHDASEQPGRASDTDWLRGKTSRLLDLVDDEDQPHPNSIPDIATLDYATPIETAGADEEETGKKSPSTSAISNSKLVSIPNARLFVRNLPFNVTENSLREMFALYGRVSEVHVVTDTRTLTGKGIGYVQFVNPSDAEVALSEMDGKDFQGRLMHILPALDKKIQKLDEVEVSKLPIKTQKALKRKSEAAAASFSWNSLHMNPDAVLASVASRLGVTKADLLNPSSADAAVKQAHAETSIIKETKLYLRSQGVNLDAFTARSRDDRTLLLKNFSFGTTKEDLSHLLAPYGSFSRLLFPPTGTMAIVQYDEASSAAFAIKQLAYRNLKGSVLFLEKAPAGIWTTPQPPSPQGEAEETVVESLTAASATLFVRNLNFATSSTRLAEAFKPLSGFLSAKVKTRTDAKKPGEVLSMGFGFVEFRTPSQAAAAVAAMNGRMLEGHELLVQSSQKSIDAAEDRRKGDAAKKANAMKTKIIIKNLPFEASKTDIRALFGAYGKLRTIRLPKKFDSSTRGFAFAEFVTAREAQNAMEALTNTHLLGRRLVLDFAEAESVDPEAEIRAMEKKVQGHQNTLVQHRMTGSSRRKFNIDATREDVDPL